MLSINDDQFTTWWETMINHPDDTALHLEQLEFMIELGLNLDTEDRDGLTIVDLLLREIDDALGETHVHHFDQILMWACERVTPTEEMIKQFHYTGRYHALEEILKRYEGVVIDFRERHLELDYVEVLLGYENVVDVEYLGEKYREWMERDKDEGIVFFEF